MSKTVQINENMPVYPLYSEDGVPVYDPDRGVVIVEPAEDLVEGEGEFKLKEEVKVLIPINGDESWESTGKVVELDFAQEPHLVGVKINWGEATLKA